MRDIEAELRHRPLWGDFHLLIVNEADQITAGGQIRLLQLLEICRDTIWIFTSNESLDSLDPRFVSRTKSINFSAQGLLQPAAHWLKEVAKKEGHELSNEQAAKIVRQSQNNLRTCLQELELELLRTKLLREFKEGNRLSKIAISSEENRSQGEPLRLR